MASSFDHLQLVMTEVLSLLNNCYLNLPVKNKPTTLKRLTINSSLSNLTDLF